MVQILYHYTLDLSKSDIIEIDRFIFVQMKASLN